MRKLIILLIIMVLFYLPIKLSAQTSNNKLILPDKSKIETLKKIGLQNIQKMKAKKKEAIEIAKRHGLIIRKKNDKGVTMELQYFKNGFPVYYKTCNLNAAKTVSTNIVWDSPFNLTGSGITAGIWDAGAVLASHNEFNNRVSQMDDPDSTDDHSTHVAGTMIASGEYNTNAHGMAKEATLNAYDWNGDIGELQLDLNIKVSNHSYCQSAGWEDGGMIWWGDTTISSEEDYKFGFYNDKSNSIDNLINSFRPFLLVVVAAGNDRTDIGPSDGIHFIWNYDDTTLVESSKTRPPDGGADHYDCIPGGLATAKNVLTVGAIKDLPDHYHEISDVTMESYSSWGPTDDGRIKPDIVANGEKLFSCVATSNSSYNTLSGTSMATPNVSGSIILILNELKNLYPGKEFLASTIKGLVINTADKAGNTWGPDYRFGWGLMNTKKR